MSLIQPVSIDGIEVDALIDSSASFQNEIPQYPVEEGYEVSDTMILKPIVLEMTVYVSNTPVTHLMRFGGSAKCKNRVNDVVAQLESMRAKRKLVTIVTNDRTYKNMGLENMTIQKSFEDGYSRRIPLSFVEVKITGTQTVGVPESYGKGGATGASGGTASTKKSTGGGTGGSTLYNMTVGKTTSSNTPSGGRSTSSGKF